MGLRTVPGRNCCVGDSAIVMVVEGIHSAMEAAAINVVFFRIVVFMIERVLFQFIMDQR